jgi:ABC-type dipeptide/oligopeptide/nickel transport system permease component
MSWLSLSLLALIVSLGLFVVFAGRPRLWFRLRFVSLLGFQLSGVLLATLILVTLAQLATAPGLVNPRHGSIAGILLPALLNSLLLMISAALWGSAAGLGAAFWFTYVRRRTGIIAPLIALLWVFPTFLLAIAVQEFQGFIYGATSLTISGGYGHINGFIVFWAAVVLGIRPAAYVFRRSRIVLDESSRFDYVRTASAKGLSWWEVATRHILRPALPIVISAWLISFRLMVGSLPLVEFFFGYPGLGNLFLGSFGLGSSSGTGAGAGFDADLAIAAVATLAGLFLVLETASQLVQQQLDPRLREVRVSVAES